MLAQIRKINEPIDRAQHVIGWHELVEAKFVKKTLLHHEPIAHHRRISLPPQIERITAKHWSRALFQRNRRKAEIQIGHYQSHEPGLLDRGGNKARKQRVRLEGPRFEFGMKLHADKPG